MNDKEKIYAKIRKLLALSTSPNVHEAETAMEMVNKLMTEHQIAYAEVLTKEAKATGVKDGNFHRESEVYKSFMWEIGKAAAILFDCDVLIQPRVGAFYFVGLPEDIIQAEQMYYYLRDAWKAISAVDTKAWKRDLHFEPGQYDVKRYKAGHGQGFAETVRSRANRLAYERKQEVRATNTGNALVVMKDQLLKDRLKGVEQMKGYTEEYLGRDQGIARGKAIPLSGAITKTKQDLL